ncbi:2331_t:CDS:10 [Diversispora eburnea]|uniref:2331_t:CDS:1 n=1 Tax=Diversispora eburnea TaxID=1213867 RepID=A0A9N8V8W6_9GLOM|nr:2331_t:CDS:10 [Diversispora eburnea]
MSHRENLTPNQIEKYKIIAERVWSDLKFQNISKDDLITYLCKFSCNNFQLHDNQLFTYGEGVYPIGSFINHSCRPNSIVMYEGEKQIIKSIEDIDEEEEITISYVDAAVMNRKSRQNLLKEKYFFSCQCSRCLVDFINIENDIEKNKFNKLDKFKITLTKIDKLMEKGKCMWNDLEGGKDVIKEAVDILKISKKSIKITHGEGENNKIVLNEVSELLGMAEKELKNFGVFDTPFREEYSINPFSREVEGLMTTPRKHERFINPVPFQSLTLCNNLKLKDDFYLNVVDWSHSNILSLGLDSFVYLWNTETSKLCDLGTCCCVTSVKWLHQGGQLVIGTTEGQLQIWDIQTLTKIRDLEGHKSRIGIIACYGNTTISTGSADRLILNRDQRIPRDIYGVLKEHRSEVMNTYNTYRDQLASGGNANELFIWESNKSDNPSRKLEGHRAAVRALSWSPHTRNILVSGGGHLDRRICFWNTRNARNLATFNVKSQVCNLQWSPNANEILSTHGWWKNEIIVWKYPSMEKVTTLKGHTYRVLYFALSPSGENIVTGAGAQPTFWGWVSLNRYWIIFALVRSLYTTILVVCMLDMGRKFYGENRWNTHLFKITILQLIAFDAANIVDFLTIHMSKSTSPKQHVNAQSAAVGTWYMTITGILSIFYLILYLILFCFNDDFKYNPIGNACDAILRICITLAISLPPPSNIIHAMKMKIVERISTYNSQYNTV